MKIVLIIKQRVFIPRHSNIDQMIGDLGSAHGVLGKIFTRSDIHLLVDLTGVGTYNFAVQVVRELYGEFGFPARGRS